MKYWCPDHETLIEDVSFFSNPSKILDGQTEMHKVHIWECWCFVYVLNHCSAPNNYVWACLILPSHSKILDGRIKLQKVHVWEYWYLAIIPVLILTIFRLWWLWDRDHKWFGISSQRLLDIVLILSNAILY